MEVLLFTFVGNIFFPRRAINDGEPFAIVKNMCAIRAGIKPDVPLPRIAWSAADRVNADLLVVDRFNDPGLIFIPIDIGNPRLRICHPQPVLRGRKIESHVSRAICLLEPV